MDVSSSLFDGALGLHVNKPRVCTLVQNDPGGLLLIHRLKDGRTECRVVVSKKAKHLRRQQLLQSSNLLPESAKNRVLSQNVTPAF